MSDSTRMAAIVATVGGAFGAFYTLFQMGVFQGFETTIGNSDVSQMTFMSLVTILVVALFYETIFVLKKPKNLLSNLQSGLAAATGKSAAEINRFFSDMAGKAKGTATAALNSSGLPEFFKNAASSLIQQVPAKVKVNQISGDTRRRKTGKRDVFEVEVMQTKYPTPAQLLARLRATFAALPLDPAQLGQPKTARVNQVRRNILEVAADAMDVIPPVPASKDDSVPLDEYQKKRNRRTLYFIIAVALGSLVLYLLSLYF